MGTAERRLKLMKLLCRRRYETMSNLALEFSVSVRTIQRDIDEISDMIPIYVKAGKYKGGVYVLDDYTMDRMYMTSKELLLLNKVCKEMEDRLSKDEIILFQYIIQSYTMPTARK